MLGFQLAEEIQSEGSRHLSNEEREVCEKYVEGLGLTSIHPVRESSLSEYSGSVSSVRLKSPTSIALVVDFSSWNHACINLSMSCFLFCGCKKTETR